MGLFFRRRLFIFYILRFILVFIRDTHEVVNIDYANFYWISITRYIPVTLWNGQLDQNPMSRLCDLCNVHGWHRDMGKRPLLVCSRNAGGWYKQLQIIGNVSSYTNRFICDLLGMRTFERSYPRPLAGRLFYRLCLRGSRCHDKDASGVRRAYYMEQSIRRARGKRERGTASITESWPSYKPRITIWHFKEIIAIWCHLLPIAE